MKKYPTKLKTPKWTPPTTGRIIVHVINEAKEGKPNIPTITGNNAGWKRISTGRKGQTRETVFEMEPKNSAEGQTLVEFARQKQTEIQASFIHCENV